MSRATPQMRNLASRLVAYETSGNKSSGTNPPAAFQVCEKLRPHLATLMGKGGFRALLSRALTVASEEASLLVVVQIDEDGSLEGWDRPEARVSPKELTESAVLLTAQLLGLLAAFIGDNLMLRLVREIWPKVSLEDLKFTKGDPHEEN